MVWEICEGDDYQWMRKVKVITLFIKHSASRGITALLVYVDDIIMIGNYEKERHNLRKWLMKEFEIKELGLLKYFLGIKVAWSQQGIFVSQQ